MSSDSSQQQDTATNSTSFRSPSQRQQAEFVRNSALDNVPKADADADAGAIPLVPIEKLAEVDKEEERTRKGKTAILDALAEALAQKQTTKRSQKKHLSETCEWSSCTSDTYARGFCYKHYRAGWRRQKRREQAEQARRDKGEEQLQRRRRKPRKTAVSTEN